MNRRRRIWFGIGLVVAGVYLTNASWLAPTPAGEMSVMAHRGVHQTYHRRDLTNTTCTAERIDPPTHGLLENTVPSIRAAIAAGADIVEIDVKLTKDGHLVLFHDATLDCRTNGSGRTHRQTLAALKALDIGYGYSADSGQTYPFRGQHVGQMPTLDEVLDTFSDTIFMVNFKHGKAEEGAAYRDYIRQKNTARLGLTTGERPAHVVRQAFPEMAIQSRAALKDCLKGYLLTGWFGRMPDSCENTYVPVPSNLRHVIWGWPHRFEARLQAVGSRSVLGGPYEGHGMTGLDKLDALDVVPDDYKGIIYTNKIEVVGPVLKSE